ncbi:hypothetical protein [Cupriavidus sp. D39]|uniref:hypothetical protein n=1 Tax=Cupriavidus sp. D39 TaxID=2997877 RepID=UPI00226E8C5A|nr:hypothetical protein [Cupriavidus sp. D39]MCY0855148.1 hypothetical protein [Cupriavidus sp. D39]
MRVSGAMTMRFGSFSAPIWIGSKSVDICRLLVSVLKMKGTAAPFPLTMERRKAYVHCRSTYDVTIVVTP